MNIKKWFKGTLTLLAAGGLLAAFPLTSFAVENHQHGDKTPPTVNASQPGAGSHGGVNGGMEKGGRMQGDMMGSMMQDTVLEAVYKLTGLNKQEIIARRLAGKSFVEIAKTKNISEDQLLEAVIKDHTAKIDQKVQDGMMTEKMAEQCKAHFEAKIKEILNKTDSKAKSHAKGAKKDHGGVFKKLLQQINAHKEKP